MPTRNQVLQVICQLMTTHRNYTSEELLTAISGLAGLNNSKAEIIEILCDTLHELRKEDAIQIVKGGMSSDISLTPHNLNEWTVRMTDTGKRKCFTLASNDPTT